MQSQRSLGSSWYERLPHPDQSLSGVKHGEVHTFLGAGTCMKSTHSPPQGCQPQRRICKLNRAVEYQVP
jgi:hypothetical protein